jgi:hypothetical protein
MLYAVLSKTLQEATVLDQALKLDPNNANT